MVIHSILSWFLFCLSDKVHHNSVTSDESQFSVASHRPEAYTFLNFEGTCWSQFGGWCLNT